MISIINFDLLEWWWQEILIDARISCRRSFTAVAPTRGPKYCLSGVRLRRLQVPAAVLRRKKIMHVVLLTTFTNFSHFYRTARWYTWIHVNIFKISYQGGFLSSSGSRVHAVIRNEMRSSELGAAKAWKFKKVEIGSRQPTTAFYRHLRSTISSGTPRIFEAGVHATFVVATDFAEHRFRFRRDLRLDRQATYYFRNDIMLMRVQ